MRPSCALTIAGSDPSGGAGVQADLKTFAALDVHGLSVITSVTAQNSKGIRSSSDIPPKFVREQLDAILDDYEVEWSKTGMLSNSGIIREVHECAEDHNLKLVVDPVMKTTGEAPLLEKRAIRDLKQLVGIAKVVTPNIAEAIELSGIQIKDVEDMRKAAREIQKLGPDGVLLKGSHLPSEKIHNLLFMGGSFEEFKAPRISQEIHGTGCTFSSAITAELAKGAEIREAIGSATEFTTDAIKGRLQIGAGIDSANPLSRVWKVSDGSKEIQEVQEAVQLFVENPKSAQLIPEVGTNIAMVPRGAKRIEEVIGLSGRIVRAAGKPQLTGVPMPGGSKHIATATFTASQNDPRIRSGINIRYSEELIERCRESNLEVVEINRKLEPPGVKTMKWAAEKAIKKVGKAPDIFFDKGAFGKEPMIRILGELPQKVVQIALQIAKPASN